MSHPLAIGILGPLQVALDGVVVPIRSRMQRLLLARLVVGPGAVATDALVDSLWGDTPPPAAASTLKTHLSNLRGTLSSPGSESVLVGHRGSYELLVGDDQVDARRFEAMVRNAGGDSGALRRALVLWRGAAYDDVRDEPFAQAEAARLEELRLLTVETCIDSELAQGRHAELVPELEALTARHPLREHLRAQLMTALYRCGRQADALGACTALRDMLREELGIDPGPEVQEVERQILTQHSDLAAPPAAVPARVSGVPIPVTDIIGREDEVTAVVQRLGDDRLVVFTGAGGIGKTTLALTLAHQLRDRHMDGAAYVDLAAVPDPAAVPHAIARAVGAPPAGDGGDVVAAACDWLAGREMLLVIDNCEHVLDRAARDVGRLLAAAPGLVVLATSREPLGIVGEAVHPVPPLTISDDPAEVTGYDDWPALQLFARRASAARPSFTPDGSNVADAARICAALDGLPLAIELAAARVAHLSPAQILERLDDRFGLLTAADRRLDRHQTLRRAIDWSYDLLDPAEQRLFARLSVFVGEFALDAVEEICDDDDTAGDKAGAPVDVLETLASLVRKSLVVTVDHGRQVRYRLLETLRGYASQRLTAAGDTERLRRSHRDWYLSWVESYPVERSAWETPIAETFRGEHPNLRAALTVCADDDRPDLFARLLAGTVSLWRQGGGSEFAECQRMLRYILEHAEKVDDESAAACHMLAAFIARMTRNDETVGEAAPAVLAVRRAPGSGWAACGESTQAHRGAVRAVTEGDPSGPLVEDTLRHVTAAGLRVASLPRPWHIPVAWELSMAFLTLARYEDARAAAAAGIADPDTLDPTCPVEEFPVRGCLTVALHLLGDHEGAARVAAPAVAAIEAGNLIGGWMTVHPRAYFAVALAGIGKVRLAERLARDGLPRSTEIATASNAADFVIALGCIAGLDGRWVRAARLLGAARRMGEGDDGPFRSPMGYALYREYNQRTRTELGEDRSRPAWKSGYALAFAEAVALALAG